MRPVFFKVTLWNDPQKGAKRPAEWGACHGANRLVARALLPPLSVYRSATAPKQADSVRAVWCSAPRALRKAAGDA